MKPGKFIVLEGIDGSGKSTQCQLLAEFLRNKGNHVILTREPSDFETGKHIRRILRGEEKAISGMEFQKLYIKDRQEHLEKTIEPALHKGEVVVCDRYFFSTIAYGSITEPTNVLEKMNSSFRVPDLTIILDIPIEESLNRIKVVRNIEFFENENKLAKVMKVYHTFPKKYPNIHMINGRRPANEVLEDIKALVLKHL